MTDPRIEDHQNIEGIDAIAETSKALVLIGPSVPLKTVLDVKAPILEIHSRHSKTQLALLTHKLRPDVSLSQICRVIKVDLAAVSRARKALMQPCPHCGQLYEPHQ